VSGERLEGEWRCSACGHGEHLCGCAIAVVYGRLEANGELTEDHVTQDGLFEDSVECIVHQSTAPLERWIAGAWCRFQRCEKCDGRGETQRPREFGGYSRHFCRPCNGRGGHWVPVAEAVMVDA